MIKGHMGKVAAGCLWWLVGKGHFIHNSLYAHLNMLHNTVLLCKVTTKQREGMRW